MTLKLDTLHRITTFSFPTQKKQDVSLPEAT